MHNLIEIAYLVAKPALPLVVASLIMWWYHEGLTRELIIVTAIVLVLPILAVFALVLWFGRL